MQQHPLISIKEKALGTTVDSNLELLTIHAEILNRIMLLKDDARYLIRPKVFVKLGIAHLLKMEKNSKIKRNLEGLLLRCD